MVRVARVSRQQAWRPGENEQTNYETRGSDRVGHTMIFRTYANETRDVRGTSDSAKGQKKKKGRKHGGPAHYLRGGIKISVGRAR